MHANSNPGSTPRGPSFEGLLIGLFIVLTPFQDSILKNTALHMLGANLSIVPLGMVLLWNAINFAVRRRGLSFRAFGWIMVAISITAITSAISLYEYANTYSVDLLIYKTFTNAVLFGTVFLTIFVPNYRKTNLKYTVLFAFLLAAAGAALDLFHGTMVNDSIFHATRSYSDRPRGFSMESSHFGATVGSLGLLAAYFWSGYKRWLILALASLLIVFSTSKGGLALWTICMAFMLLGRARQARHWRQRIALICLLLPLAGIIFFVGSSYVTDQISTGLLSDSTSLPTRVSLFIASLYIAITHPLGVGFSGVIPAISQNISYGVELLRSLGLTEWDYSEALRYGASTTGDSLSAKNFLLDGMIIWGFPFVYLFFRFFTTLAGHFRSGDHLLLGCSVLFVFMALSTYVSPLNVPCLSVVLGISYDKLRKKDLSCRPRFPVSA